MKKIFECRRSFLAFYGMNLLFILGFKYPGAIQYVAFPIGVLAGGVALANAWEGKKNESKI